MIIYDYNANAILAQPIPDRKSLTLQKAFLTLFSKINLKGYKISIIYLDNEIFKDHLNLLEEVGLKVQLVPPYEHWQNLAEQAIQIYKNYFVASLSGADPSFLFILWDSLILQANIMINLLRSLQINPKLLAYAQIFGQFDYNATPLAPPGYKCIVHDKPTAYKTWAVYKTKAYYTSPVMKHY